MAQPLGTVEAYSPLKKGKFCELSAGHRRVGRMAVVYSTASYSYDLLVSSDSDLIF